MKLTDAMKDKLRAVGRQDMIDLFEAGEAGYCGIMPNGQLVDRRKVTEAYPVVGNPFLNLAPAKQLENDPHADWFKHNPTTI